MSSVCGNDSMRGPRGTRGAGWASGRRPSSRRRRGPAAWVDGRRAHVAHLAALGAEEQVREVDLVGRVVVAAWAGRSRGSDGTAADLSRRSPQARHTTSTASGGACWSACGWSAAQRRGYGDERKVVWPVLPTVEPMYHVSAPVCVMFPAHRPSIARSIGSGTLREPKM